MKYSLYLGCVIPNRYPGIEASARRALSRLAVELLDMNGASCCPAPGVIRAFNIDAWLALAARNLSIAEGLGADVITLCNGCFATLADANHILKNDPKAAERVNAKLAEVRRSYKAEIEVYHITEVLYKEIGLEKIKESIERELPLRLAIHYGCHLMKPSKTRRWGVVQRPTFFEELVEALGATSVEYKDKMMCCGAGGAVRSGFPDVALDFTVEKLENIQRVGVDAIVNVCPFCHLQLDQGQVEIESKLRRKFEIPVVYYTQLLGLAQGFTPEELGVYMNKTSPTYLDKLREAWTTGQGAPAAEG
ncbi:MAG: CoB--CoM heterodisulfide reductase subunit B, partial [Aigarchaeota archaeon]|nr:CoB--CoM heterodisulfide reductase subunit B [Aigarchaeota archaeon]